MKDRKPLIIRGARQVGKTWLVRNLAERYGKQLLEINLEKKPQLAELFTSNEPATILFNLSAAFNLTINPQHSLLFLDEIQAVPSLLARLRWFAEEMPELTVIAAGSLLEFALAEHIFSMPVGRVNYAYLEPLSFEEFLTAHEQTMLNHYLTQYDFTHPIPAIIHQKLLNLFKEYLIVGGLPAAVVNWLNDRSLNQVNQIHHDLLATYRNDFAKYKGRVDTERLDEAMLSVPRMLGKKFVFSHVSPGWSTQSVKKAVDLLEKARVCHAVISSAANGIPLRSEINHKFFKEIFIDVGLCSAALGISFNQIISMNEITLINQGGLAEQVTGQILRTIEPFYIEPALYYWQRDVKGSNAEIDYIIQHHNQVIPIEVKAGKTGSLKSLHLFMDLKKYPVAVRINSDFPNNTKLKNFELLSIPFYLLGQIHRLLEKNQV